MFNIFDDMFDGSQSSIFKDDHAISIHHVNPATGLPMIMADSIGGVDVGGSPYGFDSHSSLLNTSSGFHSLSGFDF